MKKIYIWGLGQYGKYLYRDLKNEFEVIGFIDNDENKWGEKYDDIEFCSPDVLNSNTDGLDRVIMTTLVGYEEIREQFIEEGWPISLLDTSYVDTTVRARINFCKRFAEIIKVHNIGGSVAEAGVFKGEFAKIINGSFPDKKCYLFDTFEGFEESDLKKEAEKADLEYIDNGKYRHFANTSEKMVYDKMPFKQKVIIKKGLFPNSAKDVDDKFCFVNLDMDLYQPTLEGLRYFYPRMVSGGVILIHDYFVEKPFIVSLAVEDFEKEMGIRLNKMPIGDDCSIAIYIS